MLFIQLTASAKDDKWPDNSWHVKLTVKIGYAS